MRAHSTFGKYLRKLSKISRFESNGMTRSKFNHLLNSINALSHEQMEYLRRQLESKLAATATEPAVADETLQRRIVEAGLLGEVKPPITDLSAYRNRRAVPIQGEPLSETVIHERR